MGYTFQAMTPFEVTGLTGSKMVMDIEHCKFLDYEDCEDPCRVGCRKSFRSGFESSLKLLWE